MSRPRCDALFLQTLPASLSKPRAAPDCLRDHSPQPLCARNCPHAFAEQIDQIVYPRVRFTNPILLDKANGIIAGHGRVQKLGLVDLPCMVVAGWSEAHGSLDLRRIVMGCDDDHCAPGTLRGDDENVTVGRPRHGWRRKATWGKISR
jgi:hypothetical protein